MKLKTQTEDKFLKIFVWFSSPISSRFLGFHCRNLIGIQKIKMAAAMRCISSCLVMSHKFKALSLSNPISAAIIKPLSFSANTSSLSFFSPGLVSMSPLQRFSRRTIVSEAAPSKKADSAAKRARQAEKKRIFNRARKSEIRTRMRKVLEELDLLRKNPDAKPEEVLPIERLIAEAYSVIDKAVRAGTLHRNTGARRKARLARNKKAVEIHHEWYTPAPEPAPAA